MQCFFHAFSLSQHLFTWDNMVIVLYHPARVANLTVGVRNTMQSTVGCITQSSCDPWFFIAGKNLCRTTFHIAKRTYSLKQCHQW